MSHCKQCQVHVNALRDLVLRGGTGSTLEKAGVQQHLNMTIDYYGSFASDDTCETAAQGTEHGPTMCTTDRYHLCAQQLAGPQWFDFAHCMWMNIDRLKCGNNGACETRDEYHEAFSLVYPMCTKLIGIDAELVTTCAEGPQGVALQQASYARTSQRSRALYGFAPVFVDGDHVEEPSEWRDAVDPLAWGQGVLQAICGKLREADVPACKGLVASNIEV